MKRRTGLVLLASAAVAAAIVLAACGSRGAGTRTVSSGAVAAPGSAQRFAYLSTRHSSRCGTPAAYVLGLPPRARLQGSCCFPMARASYFAQVAGLRAYRALPEIPRDPYDIPVRLATRLLGWEHTIALSPAQSATYRRAMSMSHEHGPCCCPCWRWHAFSGLSKELIARRRWTAGRLAHLIDLVEGCGGGKHRRGSNMAGAGPA